MALSPSALGKRYTPLLAIAAVQVLLVAMAPSNSPTTVSSAGLGGNGSNFSAGTGTGGGSSASGPGAGTGSTGTGTGASGGSAGSGTGALGGGGGGGGSSSGTGGSGTGAVGGGGGNVSTGPVASGGSGATVADPGCVNGRQAGPTYYMPPCLASYHPDPQATMTGVSATQIKFIYYIAMGNAEVNAILGAEQLAATPQQYCQAEHAFTTELNKRYEFYGRKLVSIDGPGNHSGAAEGGGNCAFFQGQCNLTPPDIPCYEAEADLIASMKPAFVIAPVSYPQFFFRLAQDHVVVAGGSAGGENIPEAYYNQLAPYYYNVFPSGTQTADQLSEFYCKKMVGRPVQFAGQGPNDVRPVVGTAPIRKVAVIYPSNNGDTIVKTVADQFVHQIQGCGATGTQEFQYASDITTAQSQTNTIVAGIKQAHITTVVCLCDPIAPVFTTNTLDQQGYHPEFLIPGSGLLDYDVLGQLYNKNEMRYAFGPSELTDAIPFAQSDAVKAWQDAGNSGQPDNTENLGWAYYSLMGSALQMAGPDLTVANIRAGLTSLGRGAGGTPTEALTNYSNPYPWTAIKDFREVWFCPTSTSPINGQPGAYQPSLGGRRFQIGQLSSGDGEIFPNGPCA